ncbi:MAG: hypothetical protein V3S43_06160 [Acidimicrobiia bacterium]
MRYLGDEMIPFPERGNKDDLPFEPVIVYRTLGPDILAAARTRIEGTWAAYIGSAPSSRHEDDVNLILAQGAKLTEEVARAVFPKFNGVEYAP